MSESTSVTLAIKEILRRLRGEAIDVLQPEDDFVRILGLESIELMDLVLELEERFGLEFGDFPEALLSLARLARHVEDRLDVTEHTPP